ncbi:MAG: hypothetical protein OEZ39_15170 [Gammaproteobacteria bacterium]|nr:hypothetical protein [Gammaproteobacteria bacterium]MDH5653195.1 hypothetical protein [Gammaproteobacteria bacterium]
MTDALTQATVFFTLVLALSLLTERLIEMVKVLFDYLDLKLGWDKHWSHRAEKLHTKLKNILGYMMKTKPALQEKVLARYKDKVVDENSAVLVISGDKIRVVFTQLAAKFIGIAFGIYLAYQFRIDLFNYVQVGKSLHVVEEILSDKTHLRIILSGVIIGLGSGPVHKVITTIERSREKARKKAAAQGGA